MRSFTKTPERGVLGKKAAWEGGFGQVERRMRKKGWVVMKGDSKGSREVNPHSDSEVSQNEQNEGGERERERKRKSVNKIERGEKETHKKREKERQKERNFQPL